MASKFYIYIYRERGIDNSRRNFVVHLNLRKSNVAELMATSGEKERERESAVTKPRRVECANGARGLDGVCADPYIGSSSQRVEKGWSEQE